MKRGTHHVLFIIAVTLFAVLFYSTFASVVAIWWRSETFAHGFIIVPLVLYLVWGKRQYLAATPFATAWWSLVFVVPAGIVWMLGRLTDVVVVEQFAAVAMLPMLVWALYGWRILKELSFPLAFLFFAVPAGQGLIPYLIDFTAMFTVAAIKLTGIPVFFEGNLISLPTGDWSVVTACSGVRYLMASVTLGVFYAYITYHSQWRRLAFIAVAIAFPIIANGLRAFMIVMIGHFSNMKLATGVDHIVYGWVFFGVVMFVMFWLGGIWRQYPDAQASPPVASNVTLSPPVASYSVFVLVVTLVALWPAWVHYIQASVVAEQREQIVLPDQLGAWRLADHSFTNWSPVYHSASSILENTYVKGGRQLGVYIAYYHHQTQHAELINAQNTLFDGEQSGWIQLSEQVINSEAGAPMREYVIKSYSQQLKVWQWFWVDKQIFTNRYRVKLQEALLKLSGRPSSGAAIYIFQLSDELLDNSEQNNLAMSEFSGALHAYLNKLVLY